MKIILATIILVCTYQYSNGQILCGESWPKKNSRADTITTYRFINNTILATYFPDSKLTSNFSFKTKDFSLIWMPVYQKDINLFIEKSIKNIENSKIIDTLKCKILDKNYIGVITKAKRKFVILFYIDKSGEQDIFIAQIKNRKKLQKTINYIAKNLN